MMLKTNIILIHFSFSFISLDVVNVCSQLNLYEGNQLSTDT